MLTKDKFEVLIDIGIIEVPEDYDHNRYLQRFRREHSGSFTKLVGIPPEDAMFSSPSHEMHPEERFRVIAFRLVKSVEPLLAEECIKFLVEKRALFFGAQGNVLVFEQKRDMLVDFTTYYSFDGPKYPELDVRLKFAHSMDKHGRFLWDMAFSKSLTICRDNAILFFCDENE